MLFFNTDGIRIFKMAVSKILHEGAKARGSAVGNLLTGHFVRVTAAMLVCAALAAIITTPPVVHADWVWVPLGTGMNSTVYALATDGSDNLYAGGEFTEAGIYIAQWNGASWSALGTAVINNWVQALATDGSGNLYAGGDFTTAGGGAANRIALWTYRDEIPSLSEIGMICLTLLLLLSAIRTMRLRKEV